MKCQLSIVVVGEVDHGKSTLIGRLLYETGALSEAKTNEIKLASARRGLDHFEWSYALDAFQLERDQAITVESSQIRLNTANKSLVFIDAPGHIEFLRNMISGASQADGSIMVVDVTEGIKEQCVRHAHILSVLGIKQVCVVLNKMDLIDYSSDVYQRVVNEITDLLKSTEAVCVGIIPVSARTGWNLVSRSQDADWYKGLTLLESFDGFVKESSLDNHVLRFPVQDVYRFDDDRIIVGRIESGSIKEGDHILLSPAGTTANISKIVSWPSDISRENIKSGDCVGITLNKDLFVDRGFIISHVNDAPLIGTEFQVNLFWLSNGPLVAGSFYSVRIGTLDARVQVKSIDFVINLDKDLPNCPLEKVEKNSIALVTLEALKPIPLESYSNNRKLGRVVIFEGKSIVGGGLILRVVDPGGMDSNVTIRKTKNLVSRHERFARFGHKGGVFWFTGLPGSGKSTLAMALERELFDRGIHTVVLDGDNLRFGLNSDLSFSPEDRSENIRRVSEVAGILADAGIVTITAFISPYRLDRIRARNVCQDGFYEIYLSTSLETCESRDPKGHYKLARMGKIPDFTGVGSPYESPEHPDMVLDTSLVSIVNSVNMLANFIEEKTRLDFTFT